MLKEAEQHLANEISVLGNTVLETPGAIYHEVMDEWDNHRKDMLVRTGESAALGLVTGIALSKVPGITKFGLAGMGAYGIARTFSGLGSLAVNAWDANTDEQRQALVQGSMGSVGKGGAAALETTLGFTLGGGTGALLSSKVAALDTFSTNVARGIHSTSDRFMVGPGVEKLSSRLLGEDASVNMLALSDELASRHPWTGNEVSRSIRLSDLKAGPAVVGEAEGIRPFKLREGRMDFHTHPPVLETTHSPVSGARPSVKDVLFTEGTGLIRSGSATTLYKGLNTELVDLAKPFVPKLNAVVVDPSKQVAVQLENEWNPTTKDWHPSVPRLLDYDQTVKLLSRWKSDWSDVSKISSARVDQLGRNLHAISFLRLGVYDANSTVLSGS